MDFLSRIDWHNHDGVNFGMINDFMRNQFYDRVLARYVEGQYCTDIGFGTGLLSMLAIRHGAKHIRAFESDHDRFLLGCEIIHHLKLQNQIELINERYTHDCEPTPITFTETVNGNLWWEGLWNSLPKSSETLLLPGTYFLEIWALPIPYSFAQGLCRLGQSQQQFSPAVDVDHEFVSLINKLAGKTQSLGGILSNGIVNFERQQDTDWGWVPYLRAALSGKVVGRYCAQHWQPTVEDFVLNIDTKDWRDSVVLIVPRMGMEQDADRLYLDTGHWGPAENPILVVNPTGQLQVQHSVQNGIITYSME